MEFEKAITSNTQAFNQSCMSLGYSRYLLQYQMCY